MQFIIVLDRDLNLNYCDPYFASLLPPFLSANQEIKLSDILSESSYRKFRDLHKSLIRQGGKNSPECLSLTMEILSEHQEYREADVKIILLKSKQGEIEHFVVEAASNNSQDEGMLRAAQQKLFMLSESSLVGVYIYDRKSFVFVNKALCEHFGYSKQELLTLSPLDLVYPDDRPLVAEKMRLRFEGVAELTRYGFRGQRKDGTIIKCEVIGARIEYNGSVTVMGTLLDVTEREKTETALNESEKKFRDLVSNLSVGVYCNDLEGQMQDCNFAHAKMFGYDSIEEFRKTNASFFYARPEDRLALIEKLKAKGIIKNIELRLKKKDGTLFWGLITAQAEFDPDGNISLINGIIEDITERKESEERLVESRLFLADIINSFPDAILVIDKEGTVMAWNKAIELMTGVKAEKMIGKKNFEYSLPFYGERRPILIDLVLDENRIYEEKYQRLGKGSGYIFGEAYMPNLRGGKVYLWGSASVLRNSKGEVIGAIETIRDMTEHKNSLEALKGSRSELHEQKNALEKKNIALKEIIGYIDLERKSQKEQVGTNVDRFVLPVISKLKKKIKGKDKVLISILEENLKNLTSSFGIKLSNNPKLTPRETEICNLIKNGLSGKEIAEVLSVSYYSVETHRRNIRKKLGITRKSKNLQTYLTSI